MLEPLLAKGFIPAEKVSDEDDTLPLNLCLEASYVVRKDVIEVSSTLLTSIFAVLRSPPPHGWDECG